MLPPVSPVTSLWFAVAALGTELAFQVSGYQGAALTWVFGTIAALSWGSAFWGLVRDGWFPRLREGVVQSIGSRSWEEASIAAAPNVSRSRSTILWSTGAPWISWSIAVAGLLLVTFVRVMDLHHDRVMLSATRPGEFPIVPGVILRDGRDLPPLERATVWEKYKNMPVGWTLPLFSVLPADPLLPSDKVFVTFDGGEWARTTIPVQAYVAADRVSVLRTAKEGTLVTVHGRIESVGRLGIVLQDVSLALPAR